mmetsp:Transcript_48361/g.138133  ORF Transcript_48361/g.138133 Transcript_48361/m.138133 type:complete len:846 (+) Transcript_48361:70-2607(+)
MRQRTQVTVEDMCGSKVLRSRLVSQTLHGKLERAELERCEVIGHGAYGMVQRVQDKTTGRYLVMKTVVRPNGWDSKRLKMEAELLQNFDHPYILRIFAWYEDSDTLDIVMEHCEGGELIKVVRAGRRGGHVPPEKWLATAIKQTFEALVYIHAKGVVHKDLKNQNLLLLHRTECGPDGSVFDLLPHVVVCDLGIAEVCCRGIFGMRGTKVAGTPATMAPEVWMGSCGPKSDVWSMGCVLYELFTNRLPFDISGGVTDAAKQRTKWLDLHRKGPNWMMMSSSREAKCFNRQLLTFKEGARPTAVECLRHQWLMVSDCQLTSTDMDNLCEAVQTWRERSPMQRAFCLKLAAGCDGISKFARVFSKFDTDKSGVLERCEVVAALQSLGIDRISARKAAAALDVNGDSSCEYLEFAAACILSLKEEFDGMLRQEFKNLDVSFRGSLTPREMKPLLEELMPLAAAHGLQLEEIDSNSDGVISFSEFCGYFGRPGIDYSDDFRRFDERVNGTQSLTPEPTQHARPQSRRSLTAPMLPTLGKKSFSPEDARMGSTSPKRRSAGESKVPGRAREPSPARPQPGEPAPKALSRRPSVASSEGSQRPRRRREASYASESPCSGSIRETARVSETSARKTRSPRNSARERSPRSSARLSRRRSSGSKETVAAASKEQGQERSRPGRRSAPLADAATDVGSSQGPHPEGYNSIPASSQGRTCSKGSAGTATHHDSEFSESGAMPIGEGASKAASEIPASFAVEDVSPTEDNHFLSDWETTGNPFHMPSANAHVLSLSWAQSSVSFEKDVACGGCCLAVRAAPPWDGCHHVEATSHKIATSGNGGGLSKKANRYVVSL